MRLLHYTIEHYEKEFTEEEEACRISKGQECSYLYLSSKQNITKSYLGFLRFPELNNMQHGHTHARPLRPWVSAAPVLVITERDSYPFTPGARAVILISANYRKKCVSQVPLLFSLLTWCRRAEASISERVEWIIAGLVCMEPKSNHEKLASDSLSNTTRINNHWSIRTIWNRCSVRSLARALPLSLSLFSSQPAFQFRFNSPITSFAHFWKVFDAEEIHAQTKYLINSWV